MFSGNLKYCVCMLVVIFSLISCKRINVTQVNYNKEQILIYALSHKEKLTQLLQEEVWNTVYLIDNEEYSYEDLFTKDMKEFITEIYVLSNIARKKGLALDDKKLAFIKEISEEYYNLLKESKLSFFNKISSNESIYNIFLDYALSLELKENLLLSDEFEISDSYARVIEVEEYSFTDEKILNNLKFDLENSDDISSKISLYKIESNLKKLSNNENVDTKKSELFLLENGEFSSIIKENNIYYIYKIINSYDIEATKDNKNSLRLKEINEELKKEYENYLKSNKVEFSDSLYKELREYIKYDLDIKNFFEFYEEKLNESN